MPNVRVCLAATVLAAMPTLASAADNAADLQTCRTRQIELREKAKAFKGEEQMRRLIEADLRRASREETEGDGDECLEALDHAAKLLNNEV